jgi:hypothetical protein
VVTDLLSWRECAVKVGVVGNLVLLKKRANILIPKQIIESEAWLAFRIVNLCTQVS